MLVEHHEPGNHALACEIDDGGAGRWRGARGAAERRDAAVADHDGLILASRRAGAVDDPCVHEREDRSLHLDVRRERIRRRLRLREGSPEGLRYQNDQRGSGRAGLEARPTHRPVLPALPFLRLPPVLPVPPLLPLLPLLPKFHLITSAAIAPRSSRPCPLAIASSIALAMPGRTVIG